MKHKNGIFVLVLIKKYILYEKYKLYLLLIYINEPLFYRKIIKS